MLIPRVVKIFYHFTPKSSPSLPFSHPMPWKWETLPFLFLIFIIHSHF